MLTKITSKMFLGALISVGFQPFLGSLTYLLGTIIDSPRGRPWWSLASIGLEDGPRGTWQGEMGREDGSYQHWAS